MENTELDKARISAVEEQIKTLEFLWRISVVQMGPEFVEVLIKNIDGIDLKNEEAMGMIKNIRHNLQDSLTTWLGEENVRL